MTSWLAAHHGHRFQPPGANAPSTRGLVLRKFRHRLVVAGAYGRHPDEQRRRSPLTYADRITIPFAIAHSEQDWRCPLEQAQRMFVALKAAGTDTECSSSR